MKASYEGNLDSAVEIAVHGTDTTLGTKQR